MSNKSVIMMYPVKDFLESPQSQEKNSLLLDQFQGVYFNWLKMTKKIFWNRFNLINKFLDNYRREGFSVNWIYFSLEADKNLPDISKHHPLYKIKNGDKQIATGLTYKELRNGIYPSEKELIKKSGDSEMIVVGGFHKNDCVERVINFSNSYGKRAVCDPMLTEEFFLQILNTFDQDIYAKQIKGKYLDAKMHEDNPDDEKEKIIKFIKEQHRHTLESILSFAQ